MPAARNPFAPFEIELIEQWYPHVPTAVIAKALGRSVQSIYAKARSLGLEKTRNCLARFARLQPGHAKGRCTRFQPGLTPWNKGTKGLQLGGEATQFKPGRLPHTWRPIGTYRVSKDGYLQRKLTDTRCTRRDYVPVHHLVWRLHGGAIPPGHALCFRDGDKTNLDINNLELIHRRELMARNTRHRLPEELNQVISLKAALTRRINNLEGSNQP